MFEFKTKKIRKHIPEPKKPEPPKELKEKTQHKISFPKISSKKINFGLIFSIALIVILAVGTVKAIGLIDFKFFLKAAGDELKKDSYGHTNFLILGNGGKNHDGSDLMDTMIVASLDDEHKLVTMVSIPRDLYITDQIVGSSKINEIYFNANKKFQDTTQALAHLKTKVEEIVGIPIHYYLRIDFDGFKELVDALGGIDVNVENAIYDPSYPKDGTYDYETFSISAGPHHLDGATALKYARSRKTTSDFDRAERQQQIIYAVKEKALQTEIIFSPAKINEILETLKANVDTDITTKEILTLGSLAGDYSANQLSHRLIHDDPTQCGGFLYTPERRFYNGMFVLLPAGGFEFLHLYSDLNFNQANISKDATRIQLLNGTKTGGVAGETKQILKRFCFNITRHGNGLTKDIQKTTYYYQEKTDEDGNKIPSRPDVIDFLIKLIPGQESTIIPLDYQEYFLDADLLIEFGSDYVDSEKYIDDPFYSLYSIPAASPATTPATTSTITPAI
ncbi:MAG: LCP family protein [Patescibacteria group bacterium]